MSSIFNECPDFGEDTLEVKRLVAEATLPTRAHEADGGYDVYAVRNAILAPQERLKIGAGVAVAIPLGYVGLLTGRSSLNASGIAASLGIIDSGYTGEISAILENRSGRLVDIQQGDRIGQLVIVPVFTGAVKEVTELPASDRGAGGFGSTGK